jgi:hypothetical protein
LSGQRPFNTRGKTEYSVLNAHVNDLPEPPTVHCRDIPGPAVDVVLRALAKEPDARFQSVDDFIVALPDVGASRPSVGPLHVNSGGTVALEYTPANEDPVAPCELGRTTVFEYGPSTCHDGDDSKAFNYSAATLRRESSPPQSAPSSPASVSRAATKNVAPAATGIASRRGDNSTPAPPAPSPAARVVPALPPGLMQRVRSHRAALAAAFVVAMLVLGTLVRYTQQRHAMPRDAAPASSSARFTYTQPSTAQAATTPTLAEAAALPSVDAPSQTETTAAPADLIAATAASAPDTPPTTAAAPARRDLSGTWRGEYIDASGKQLLRVVSLSISRVHHDGGIEGTLQYKAASGDGECKLRPRGSTYSADEQRLQLSPEGCSPHSPRELGVPLDFDRVNPQANTLRDGRIEAPTGVVIRVRLKRVSGI